MKRDNSAEILGTVLFIIGIIIYITNFVQMLKAFAHEEYGLAIVKLIGALTAFGSLITVWF